MLLFVSLLYFCHWISVAILSLNLLLPRGKLTTLYLIQKDILSYRRNRDWTINETIGIVWVQNKIVISMTSFEIIVNRRNTVLSVFSVVSTGARWYAGRSTYMRKYSTICVNKISPFPSVLPAELKSTDKMLVSFGPGYKDPFYYQRFTKLAPALRHGWVVTSTQNSWFDYPFMA